MTQEQAESAHLVDSCIKMSWAEPAQSTCLFSPSLKAQSPSLAGRPIDVATFDAQGLLNFTWISPTSGYAAVRKALVARYGEPVVVETHIMPYGDGPTHNVEMASWCFSDGQLAIMERSIMAPEYLEILFASSRYEKVLKATTCQ